MGCSWIFLKYLFISLAVSGLSCYMGNLIPSLRMEPGPPTLGKQTPSHWTTREVPLLDLETVNRAGQEDPESTEDVLL